MTSETTTRKKSAGYAGFVTTLLTLTNIVVGFAFQSLIASKLGLSGLADQFQLGWTIVTFGTTVFFALVPMVLVPRIHDGSNILFLGDLRAFWALGMVATAAQAIYALTLTGSLSTILLLSAPSHILAALTCGAQAVAYLQHRFALAAAGGVANGIGLFTWVAISGWNNTSALTLGTGIAIGYLAQFIAAALPVARVMWRSRWTNQIGLRAILALFAFTLITKFQPVLERILTTDLQTGATAALGFGQKIAQGLLLLCAFGLALTAVGTISKHLANNDHRAAARILERTIATTVIATSLVSAAFIPFSLLAVHVLFVRGEFTSEDALTVQNTILLQLPWVLACALTGAMTSYLYIERAYIRVGVASVIGLVVTVTTGLALSRNFPAEAVPIASSAGAVVTCIAVALSLRKSPVWGHTREILHDDLQILILFPAIFFATLTVWVTVSLSSNGSLPPLLLSGATFVCSGILSVSFSTVRDRIRTLLSDAA
ncbi:hypothetical protein SRABI91_00779 [Rhodococcoides fascians]|nr:hypothetical protein SRABI91_00779 [Rhodococcus fascians]